MSGHLRDNPTYVAWSAMKRRCYNPNWHSYHHYGGRGITVCEHWLHNFANFLKDMGEKPSGLTLDRINTDGNYEKTNCRWATRSEQALNRRPKPFCKYGHALTVDNITKDGDRSCLICRSRRQQEYIARLKVGI